MIVHFAVDPDALTVDGRLDRRVLRAQHMRLLELWRDFGTLIYGGPDFCSSELFAAFNRLPQDLRKRWQEALERHRHRAVSGWRALDQARSLAEVVVLRSHIELACLEQQRYGHIAGAIQPDQMDQSPVELCSLDHIDQTNRFCGARQLARQAIAEKTDINRLWTERFARLVEQTKLVVVVDRYAVVRHWHFDRKKQRSGLEFLLAELHACRRRRRTVIIYAAADKTGAASDGELAASVQHTVQSLGRGAVQEVQLFIGPDKLFGAKARDRYLRFDRAVCELGHGLEVLEGDQVQHRCAFALRSLHDESQVERGLQAGARAHLFKLP
jgi:hypothetical protein